MASRTGKESFLFPASSVTLAIAEALAKKGYVSSVSKKGKKGRYLELTLPRTGTAHTITGVKRISHLSKRLYQKARNLKPVRNGFGMAVLSTPRGILSDADARAAKVGGEVLFEIW